MKLKINKNLIIITIITLIFISGVFVLFKKSVFASTTDDTIDSTYKYAWGENIGWLNFGTSEGNVHITDSALTGYAWGENIGWINLNPTYGGVTNDGEGNLSGYAWGENVGWINFNPTGGGVTIDSNGDFSGYAWGENIGWIIFNCATTDSCSSVDYKVKTDWRPQSARPAAPSPVPHPGGSRRAYIPPAPPSGGFSILIQGVAEYTNSQIVTLKLDGGPDTKKMAISNFSDFQRAGQEAYQTTKTWTLTPGDGIKIVYVKFYTQYGQASEVVSDTIILDMTAPEIKITKIKDYYRPDENIVLAGTTEAKAEITLYWNKKYGLAQADDSGRWIVNLGKMSVGKYPLELTPKDRAGNIGESLTVDLIVEAVLVPEIPEKPEEEIPEEIITVPEEAPLVMQGQWQLLPPKPIREFVLAPLPKEIKILTEKFPELEKTFEKIGITKITDIEKLKTVKLTLPGLTETLGLPIIKLEPGKFALPMGIPVAELSSEIKQKIPSEIVFAKTGGELIDFDIALTVTEKGELQQKITTISGKPLQLVVKPDKPVKSIKGYVVFKSKKKELGIKNQELSLDSLLASMVFASPSFAKEYNPIEIEERLLLLEFEYTDPDGDGIFTAEIQAPLVEGEYEIITVMDYEDPDLGTKEIRLIIVVDPEGYVYEKDRDKETRIPGAIVSIFWLNSETKQYELWPAKEYQQENPQITNATGKYSFLVPEGSYYLKVEAPGYLIYDGKPFQVKEGSGVHVNIELKTKYWWLKVVDWKTILLIAVILLLLYNFYRDKIRERLLRRQSK